MAGQQRDDALAVPAVVLVGRIDRVMVHDDDALAAFSGVGDFGFQPVELAVADHGVPGFGIDGAGALCVRRAFRRRSRDRMAGRPARRC